METMLVFDMDGTIANLYGVPNWLEDLRNFNPNPYINAKPMYDMVKLVAVLRELQAIGYRIAVVSWLSKESTPEYDRQVRQAKRDWLKKYSFPADEIHIVKYGTTKANCTRKAQCNQILFDDKEQVRKGWHLGATVDANNDILPVLEMLKGLNIC